MRKNWGLGSEGLGWAEKSLPREARGAAAACAALILAACASSSAPPPSAPSEGAQSADTSAPSGPQKAEEGWAGEEAATPKADETSSAPGDTAKADQPAPGEASAPAAAPAPAGGTETRTTQAISDVVAKNRPKI